MGAALLAVQNGMEVLISDAGTISSKTKEWMEAKLIPFEENGHNLDVLLQADMIIKSPGIPPSASIILDLKKEKIPIISEIEWASRYCKGEMIAITGSNGKTTVTNLIAHLMDAAGESVVKCGNVGTSFSRAIVEREADYFIIEVSSFQLEDIVTFHPSITVLTNITPDHLDRYHGDLKEYGLTKLRIAMNQTKEQFLVLGNVDEWTLNLIHDQKLKVSIKELSYVVPGQVPWKDGVIHYDNPCLNGKHNAANVSCAVQVCDLLGADKKAIEKGLMNFVNDAHRMERVDDIDGVLWINDSKATNVDAVYFALEAQGRPIIWIAGGTDKGNDYSSLTKVVKKHVKALVAMGVDNSKLLKAFDFLEPAIRDTHDMGSAVRLANEMAEKGDVVLLSPACASFDLFDNYKHRGDRFREEVKALKKKNDIKK